MKSLDIIEKKEQLKPLYQPIVSAVTHEIAGYEIFAAIEENGVKKSLANFFLDDEVPGEFKLEIDQYILKQAIQTSILNGGQFFLTINRTVEELMIRDGEPLLELSRQFEKENFSMNRIVLEIKEDDIEEYFDDIYHLLLYYKNCGIQIAIDQLGKKTANLDRIRQLEPHILKMNTRIIGSYETEGYEDIMYSFEMLADRIGAALLFENVEDDFLQYFAWKHGGRYYQGYYLARPSHECITTNDLEVNLEKKATEYIKRQKKLIEERLAWMVNWEDRIKKLLISWTGPEFVNVFLEEVTKHFDHESFRIYVCNGDGKQVSANFRKESNFWMKEKDQEGANWAFRPYFLANLMQMKLWNRAMLSDLYSDIETRELIRTFSFPLADNYFIFIDMSYSFLYNKDCLLI
ncbi:EAL domain-containing protein (putative c-di-GMP-specific phosphodiesterase class I) [Natronobacillus azotifigens]|uniref:EAL domain-containing protein n=1 Tax=Natronobacillus azotifigens TaxID=472978 RepID=A0A9J6R8S5_9BACI|nr:EAL-associated domain-containing protein [Natronobacillus azotifigens]MCZ0701715.1 EAL domain-containing protein [Natronobacillus azotifigens]